MLNIQERPTKELRLLSLAGIKTPASYHAHPPTPRTEPPRSRSSKRAGKTLQGGRTDIQAFQAFQLPLPAHPPRGCSKVLAASRAIVFSELSLPGSCPLALPQDATETCEGDTSPWGPKLARGVGEEGGQSVPPPRGLHAAALGPPGPRLAGPRAPARLSITPQTTTPHARATRRAGSTGVGSVQAAPPQPALCPGPGMAAAASCPGPTPSCPPRL